MDRQASVSWGRVLATAVVLEAPVAWLAAAGRLPVLLAAILGLAAGYTALLSWELVQRRSRRAEAPVSQRVVIWA